MKVRIDMIHALYRSLGSLRAWVTVIIGAVAAAATWRSPNRANAAAPPGAASSSLSYRKHTLSVLALLAAAALGLWLLLPGGALHAQDAGTIMYAENGTGPVATYTAVDPEGKAVTWSVAAAGTDFSAVDGIDAADATDAAHLEIDAKTGVLTFSAEDGPDFEMPRDTAISGTNTNTYKVVIAASTGADDVVGYHAVTVEVENVDEAATTTIDLTSIQPRASVEIGVAYVDGVGNPFLDPDGTANALIVDPDGSKDDTTVTSIPAADVEWQWSKSTTRAGTFTDIDGATAATYTPDSGDVSRYLRLTATYEDGEGEDKTLEATSAYPVLGSRSSNSDPAFQDDFDPNTDGDQEPAVTLDDGATAGDNVGAPITASDAQNDRLTYSLSGSADADVFQIDRRTGQVTVGLGKTVSPAGDTAEPTSVTKQATFTVTITATDPSGGSDTATLTITMDETDEAPMFTAGKTSHEYAEAETDAVYTFAAYDPEAAAVTYAVSGTDASKFSITAGAAGELTFLAPPDYEAPGDADKDNVYELTVKASDASTPAKSTSINVTVTVTNVEEAGSVTLSASQPRIGVQITANTPTDPDGGVTAVTWQWQRSDAAAADGTWTDIKDATAAGYTPVADDDGKFIRAVATYTDNEGSGKTATGTPTTDNVAVAKVRNLAPAFTDEDTDTSGLQIEPREVPENAGASGVPLTVGDPVVATDAADADTTDDTSIFYTLSGDAAPFEIADAGSDTGAQIQVKTGAKLDHETKDTYVVTVTARDPEGLSSSVDVTIEVTDVDEGPEISGPDSEMYAENGTGPVATYTAVDPEGKAVTWSVAAAGTDFSAVDGIDAADATDAAHLEIDAKTGVLTFSAEDGPDFEMPRDTAISGTNTNTYKVVIAASTGADDVVGYHAVTVEVENVDEAATTTIDLTSIQPRASVEIGVAYVDGVGNPFLDPDGTANALIVDPDGSKDDTTVTSIPAADVEWQWSKSTTRAGTFTDIDGATAATYTPDSGDVSRYLRLTATYEDGEGEDKTLEATSAYPVLGSRSSNSDPAFQDDFDPNTDGDQEPAVTLDDGATAGDNVGAPITASDAQNDRLTYSLSGSADADVFQIDRRTGQVTVGLGKTVSPAGDTAEPTSVTKQATFTVTITATDPSGGSDTATLTITMDETDEAPMFTAGKTSHEYAEAETDAVYTFAAYDPEAAAVTYAVSGTDASKFSITAGAAGELTFLAPPDYEAPGDADKDNVYELTVKASDASTPAKSTSINVTVTVTNVEEAGSVTLSASQPRIGVQITANTPTDPDGGVTAVTWQWQRSDAAAADGTWTDIKDATAAGYTPVADDDGKFIRAVATYTDNEGSGKTATGTPTTDNVAVAKVRNLAPAFTDEDTDTSGLQIEPREVPENAGASGVPLTVGDPVVATDAADADTTDDTSIFYTLSGDAAPFEIADAGSDTGAQIQVKTGAKLDHETKDTYVVTVTARDPEGLSSSVDVTIEVTDVDEGPEITRGGLAISGPASPRYAEGRTDAVATYTLVGPDAASATLMLGGDDAAAFTLTGGVLTFNASPDFETPASADGNNAYEVTLSANDGTYTAARTVTVTVTNVDEAGTLTLSSATPAIDVPLTATLEDLDGVVSAEWQWALERQSDGSYVNIAGATSAAYTPVAADEGSRLQVTVTYTDGHGAGKELVAPPTSAVVAGDPLVIRYDVNPKNGEIDKAEVIQGIDDFLFGEGDQALSRPDVIKLIEFFLFGIP